MSDSGDGSSVDMVRWTFTVEADKRGAIEAHLVDLGLDVMVVGEGQFHVVWEEPDRDMDEVAAELWDLNGSAFEISQEEFHRVSHVMIHSDESDAAQAA